ncbi:MAG: sigma-54-dependent Fis family transcriptional regulator, partial [Desulfitobacterium hafniense]|nr:sigma-54-dependent Fis family transcriptional regulator [Desulfitobacterium hafniense]
NGQFREDLFYRINILNLELPPLLYRNKDIVLLVNHFIKHFCKAFNRKMPVVSPEGLNLLQNYHWPGNVRELRNVVERLIITTAGDQISYFDVLDILDELSGNNLQLNPADSSQSNSLIDQEELRLILKILEKTGGNRAEAARQLGISKTTLWRKLKNVNTISS